MDKTSLLYDHYKETNAQSKSMQDKRGRLFIIVCIELTLLFLFIINPMETFNSISEWIKENLGFQLTLSTIIVQALLWFITLFTIIRYYQANIYIQRLYEYLNIMESEISSDISVKKIFNRDGDYYNNKYPMVLTMIDHFYKWVFPIALCLIVGFKIAFEWIQGIIVAVKIVDTAIAGSIIVLTIMYLVFIHRKPDVGETEK